MPHVEAGAGQSRTYSAGSYLTCQELLKLQLPSPPDDIRKRRCGPLQGLQHSMLQGALGNSLVVFQRGCPSSSSASRPLKARLIEVGVVYKDHALDAQQHLTTQKDPQYKVEI